MKMKMHLGGEAVISVASRDVPRFDPLAIFSLQRWKRWKRCLRDLRAPNNNFVLTFSKVILEVFPVPTLGGHP